MVNNTQTKVNQIIDKLHRGKHIDDMTKKWLSQTSSLPRIPVFYTLTKIHKPIPVGRPIISGCDGPTERISSFVDTLLQHIAQIQQSYITDTADCINFIEKTKIGQDTIIVAMENRKIIQMRLSDAINTILRNEQAGFGPGVGCIDHIFTLRNIIGQCIEWNTKVHINFIDLQKAFDSIHKDSLWRILLAYGCPEKIINIIKFFYNNFSCSVIHKKKLTDWFSVRSRVCQGCVLSPMLFLVAIDWIMRKPIGNKRWGIRWTPTSLLVDLDFADDIALVSATRDHLPLISCQPTGLEHRQEEDQDNAAYRNTITKGIGE